MCFLLFRAHCEQPPLQLLSVQSYSGTVSDHLTDDTVTATVQPPTGTFSIFHCGFCFFGAICQLPVQPETLLPICYDQ